MIADIQPLLAVSDYSFYYLLGVMIAILAIVVTILFLLRGKNPTATPLDQLKAVDFNHPKQAAYTISIYGKTYAKGELKEMFGELQQSLRPHKYKKTVPPVNDETKALFYRYLDACESGR